VPRNRLSSCRETERQKSCEASSDLNQRDTHQNKTSNVEGEIWTETHTGSRGRDRERWTWERWTYHQIVCDVDGERGLDIEPYQEEISGVQGEIHKKTRIFFPI